MNKLYTILVSIYAKIVPFWIIRLLPKRTAPANKRYNFIADLAVKNNMRIFIETGTYLGDTTDAMSRYVDKVYTFEISEELVQLARKRFADKQQIEIIHGDSGSALEGLLSRIHEKTIFWLDGHYSEGFLHAKKHGIDTPIIKEIETIFTSNIKDLENIILIDDAFEFDGTRGYPTIDELRALVARYSEAYDVSVAYDIVFIIPKNAIR